MSGKENVYAPSDVTEDLTAAAMWGDVALLESLLSNGADPNLPNSQGNTALHVACYYGERECASILLHYKAEVNAKGAEGKIPLHRAVLGVCVLEPGPKYQSREQISENQIDLVKLLVGNGSKVTFHDGYGDTPYDAALQCDFYECAELLSDLAKAEEQEEKRHQFFKNIDDAYDACKVGDLTKVKELMPGIVVMINECKKEYMTLLMIASREGHSAIVDYLIDIGAKVTHTLGSTAKTALHYAAENGHADVIKTLIKRLPRILLYEESPKGSSLHLAARNGHADTVKVLLDVASGLFPPTPERKDSSSLDEPVLPPDASVNVFSHSQAEGRTPLHEAVIGGHTDIVSMFVKWIRENQLKKPVALGLSPSSALSNSQVPVSPRTPTTPSSHGLGLHARASSGSSSNPLDIMTEMGRTPLHEASRLGFTEMIEILQEGGADVNAIMRPSLDRSANADLTALVQAAMTNDVKMVRFLLQHGATDARLKALTRAMRMPYHDVVGLLLCYNGSVTIDSSNMELRKRLGKASPSSPLLLAVNWASKKLPYITPLWIDMVLIEAPSYLNKPKAESYALSQLNISDNKLNELPVAIFQLKNLLRLELNRNNISSLPVSDDWECDSLEHIDMSHNQLTSLPPLLFTLPELKELCANNNAIRDVPIEVWKAPKLQKLLLQKNRLESFPSPFLSPDSGFGTLEGMSSDGQVLHSSFSVPDSSLYPHTPVSPPFEAHTPYSGRKDSIHFLQQSYIPHVQSSPVMSQSGITDRRVSLPPPHNIRRSRLRELFDATDTDEDPFDDYEIAGIVDSTTSGNKEGKVLFQLETLDLSYNELTLIPQGLCCLAPKLLKLHLHHNNLSSLGTITDYPSEIELIDGCHNQLTSAVAPARPRESLRNLTCAQKLLQFAQETMTPTRCSHRNHRVLRKLGYLKLAHNKLVDVQLFRTTERDHGTDLTSSIDEGRFSRRCKTGGMEMSIMHKDFTKSSFGTPLNNRIKGSSVSSTDDGPSSDDKKPDSSSVEVLYCLYPQLSTLDLGHNKLRSVPSHIHLISSLAVLTISHNASIDTLPLELSNLEGLWSLEYDGVPLTNPPASDLDKFRSASDKLLYMRSLLHDAKPYESMKLMLVGLQKQGKTTLLTRLREINEVRTPISTFNERKEGETVSAAVSLKPGGITGASSFFRRIGSRDAPLSTVGVDLGLWKYRKDLEPSYRGKKSVPLRSVTFYTWDFGGQEEYYATHQCFLSNRSLYLVIFNVCDGEDGIDSLELWLHNIQARAPESPVIIVGTHSDLLKEDKEQRKQELTNYLEKLRDLGLPQIKEVRFVGCPTSGKAEGVSELRVALWDVAFSLTAPRKKGAIGGNKVKLLEQPVPSSYLRLEERMRELVVKCQSEVDVSPVMKESEFFEAVQDIIPNPRELNQAVTFLHENGVLLHYATPALNHLYFIDPQWLCDMLAHVVTIPEVNRFIQRGSGPEAGILKTSVLSHIFKGKLFPHTLRNEYIELLSKFEVALLLDRNRMLVPSMLPSAPKQTLYNFKTLFPRPPIAYLLQQSRIHSSSSLSDNRMSPYSSQSDPLMVRLPPKSFSPMSPTTPDLYRTGLLLRRFYFMKYVPSGFWPRLISRFLTSSDFAVIVLKALGFSEKEIEETVRIMISGDLSTLVELEWSYWTTGVEFWYKGYSLLRVAEIRPEGTFSDCLPSSAQGSSYSRTPSIPFEPLEDCEDLSFQLNGQWLAVDETPNTGLEVLVPDYICPSVIEKVLPSLVNIDEGAEDEFDQEPFPTREHSWMSAQLLSQTVEQIDTLLEDWFPGIGSKDGGRGMYSVPYVNRVVPCPYCVGGAEVTPNDVFTSMSHGPETLTGTPSVISMNTKEDAATPSSTVTLLDNTNSIDTNSVSTTGGVASRARRDLMPSLQKTTASGSPHSRRRYTSDNIDDTSIETSPAATGVGLMQASKFGFMIETCVAASRGLATLECPTHPLQPLDISSLTPDLVFGDLPTHYIINEKLVDRGKFVASGSFGEIYHGAIYPHLSASDDEGREVAIKIDKQDRKHFNMETAAKAYTEIRAEVALLKDLDHEYIINFIGLTLQPLCFMLEWASKGSLHGILQSYYRTDSKVSPWTLVEAGRQVANGLSYLHSRNVVYYDLKSPNILVFEFPSADESLRVSLESSPVLDKLGKFPVHVKITDLGISRKITPGGVVGYKGTPAFMAPEILRYVGKEACTEKVDVFSFGMFMYELLAQQFPFERQNLMHNQIEKLVVDGARPSIQNKELSNPILYLDIMRWAWQQDYHDRPTSSQLDSVLSLPAVPHLVDAYSLEDHCYQQVTSACIVTLPIDISSQVPDDGSTSETSLTPSVSQYHTNVVRGDLQEEVWFCSKEKDDQTLERASSRLSFVSFRGRANFVVDSIDLECAPVTAMCCVNEQVWLGAKDGCITLYSAINHDKSFSRYLSLKADQGIIHISHLTKLRQVLVVRKDGYLMLLDEVLSERRIPDTSHFDAHVNATQLPVRCVFNLKTPLSSVLTLSSNEETAYTWISSSNEVVTVLEIRTSVISHCQKLQARSYSETNKTDILSHMTCVKLGGRDERSVVCGFSYPGCVLYIWESSNNHKLLASHKYDQFTTDKVTDVMSMGSMLYMSTGGGEVVTLSLSNSLQEISSPLFPISAHSKSRGIYKLLKLGCRVFPRHWLPTLIGRNNAIEYYKELLDEEEMAEIKSGIIGSQSQLLVTIGHGFEGLSSLKRGDSWQDHNNNFVLLWLPPR
uniref:non-specific serine/threonine protein kinase n=1 Tax=Amphimedon queenslandica TaxID=400682 RepID=A0A1X7UH02_AMPQE